ncbi:hypothetical protein [Cryobacterium sp. M25]|uniref:hypothetical protein n=1 Tax=Cryobacterium sp. M25 TaxID=2048293 RepID=UPI000CE46F63|nr:hypothetical protein [Cryobacterium sp. M25]
MTTTALKPGDQFHFTESGLTFTTDPNLSGAAQVSFRGQTVTITDALLEAARDRLGTSWLDLMHDMQAQKARWGREMFKPGVAPESLTRWTPGTPEEDAARDEHLKIAYAIQDGAKRAVALQRVRATFGRKTTSTQLATYKADR